MSSKARQYWDATVFTAIISNETGRVEICQRLYNDALAGRFQIYTSTLTLAECSGGQSVARRPDETLEALNQAIDELFGARCVTLIQPDRIVARRAREIQQWTLRQSPSRKTPPVDAIHVASALEVGAAVLFTYDDDHLTRLHGMLFPGAKDPLAIQHPVWTGAVQLGLSESTS